MSANNIANTPQRWMTTPKMAHYIGRSVSWLKARMGTDFADGVHYRIKPGIRDPFWDAHAMDAWITDTGTGDTLADDILQKMVS